MPLVASAIPNLVGGVSQQPAPLRVATACENSENAWLSIVNGLQKRHPTTHVANIGLTLADGATGYLIERNENYRYLAVFENGSVNVLDLNDGTFQTVNTPDGTGYLAATSPVDSFRFVTFGDYTFVSNNNISVTSSAVAEPVAGATRLDPTNMASLYVTTAAYNTYYSVYINNTLVASVLTPNGASGSNAIGDTGQIAKELYELLVRNTALGTPSSYATAISMSGASSYSSGPGYSVTQTGSVLTITDFDPADEIKVQGGSGDKQLRVFVRNVQSFSDLPPTSPTGRIVRVAGDVEAQGDDYYVVYENGIWRETLDWDQGEQLDASTMPHVLVRENDGSWTFKEHVWGQRQVGDTESSRNPSFAGTTINDIFVYTNRLGVLSDENIILSESDNFENFYRTTAAQLIDSDPIDLAVLHNNVDIMYHAIPYNRDLLLMSEKNQFRFSYQNFLGQKNSNIQFRTAFNVSKRVRPLNVGNSVYFVDDRQDYQFTKMYEFFPVDSSTQDDAEEVSASVPEFIPFDVRFMAASNRAKVIVVYSNNDPTSLYVYKYFWAGDKKVQSAWTKWTFDDCDKIYWAGFSGVFLYMLIDRPSGATLERIRLDEDVFDTEYNYDYLLDRKYELQAGDMTYDANTDITTITLPYSTTAIPEIVSNDAGNNIAGIRQAVTKLNNSELSVPGDITGLTNFVGIPYTLLHEFSTIYAKQAKGQGEVAILDGRLQLRYLTLEYHNTAYFTTEVHTQGRDVSTGTFVGATIGSEDSLLGTQPFSTGKYRLPVMSENLKARIVIKNDSPYPSALGSAEWSAIYSPKAVQRM